MRVAEALSQVVFEATEQAPAGPGRLIARAATNWLMHEAEQVSPGVPIDLGILSQAETGGVAIFLHGAVVAMLAGTDGVGYHRGVEAGFTVDRVAPSPARAAALFADTESGGDPVLPERGIGALGEGVAQAGGAVVWFEGRRSRARDRDEVLGARQHPGPAGQSTGSLPFPDVPQPFSSSQVEMPLGVPASANLRPLPNAGQGVDIPPPLPGIGQGGESAPPPAPNTGHGSDFLPPLPSAGQGSDVPPPLPSAGQGSTVPPPLPNVGSAGDSAPPPLPSAPPMNTGPELASRMAQTQLGRPSSLPAPEPEPAPGAALAVRVLGFKCARAHPSDPRSAFCTVCGMPVDQTQPPSEVVRPPLGVLILDDGTTFTLAADAVLGRDPQHSDAAQRGMTPFQIEDNSGGMSRAHAEIRLVNWDATVVDRGSTNGTRARLPGYQDWIRLAPNQPLVLIHGTELMLGNRVLRFDPAATSPFG